MSRTGRRHVTGVALRAMALLLVAAGCGGAGAVETAPPPTPLPSLRTPMDLPEATDSPETPPAMTPDPAVMYEQLVASIPDAIAPRCAPETWPAGTVRPAGEIVGAVCELQAGAGAAFVIYTQFDGLQSLRAAYEARRAAVAAAGVVEGPGCGKGPGGSTWDLGTRLCYRQGEDIGVIWTQEQVVALAEAVRHDSDWAKLEAFWQDAGPTTP
jgi:hypothetical protein